ncbi:hypothetical protein ABIB68_001619 [Bradyrhizobium sp. F1.2.2]
MFLPGLLFHSELIFSGKGRANATLFYDCRTSRLSVVRAISTIPTT